MYSHHRQHAIIYKFICIYNSFVIKEQEEPYHRLDLVWSSWQRNGTVMTNWDTTKE